MRLSRSVEAGFLVLALLATSAGSSVLVGGPHASHKMTPDPSLQILMEQMGDMMKHMSEDIQSGQMSTGMTEEIGKNMSRMAEMLNDMAGILEETTSATDTESTMGSHSMMMGRHDQDMQKKMGRMADEMTKMHQSMMGSEEQASTSHNH